MNRLRTQTFLLASLPILIEMSSRRKRPWMPNNPSLWRAIFAGSLRSQASMHSNNLLPIIGLCVPLAWPDFLWDETIRGSWPLVRPTPICGIEYLLFTMDHCTGAWIQNHHHLLIVSNIRLPYLRRLTFSRIMTLDWRIALCFLLSYRKTLLADKSLFSAFVPHPRSCDRLFTLPPAKCVQGSASQSRQYFRFAASATQ